jgi:hypothetical protein
VLKPTGDFGLVPELVTGLVLSGVLGLEKLERDLAGELGVSGLIDLAMPTRSVQS